MLATPLVSRLSNTSIKSVSICVRNGIRSYCNSIKSANGEKIHLKSQAIGFGLQKQHQVPVGSLPSGFQPQNQVRLPKLTFVGRKQIRKFSTAFSRHTKQEPSEFDHIKPKIFPRTMDKSGKTYPNLMRFDMTSEEIKSWPDQIIATSKASLDNVASTVDNPTWEGTILALFDEDAVYSTSVANCSFYSHVHADKEIRDASTEAEIKLEKYGVEKSQRYDVYLAVKAYMDKVKPTQNNLTEEHNHCLRRLMNDFIQCGMALSEAKRDELKDLRSQMSELAIQFNKNIAEDKTFVSFTKEELLGSSETYLAGLEKDEDGKYKVTMKYPDYVPAMEKVHVPETRKRLAIAYASRCLPENAEIFDKAIQLRQKMAVLLGFESPAHQTLVDRMAKNPQTVNAFLSDLTTKLDKRLDEELAAFLEVKKESALKHGQPFDPVINSWDRTYCDQLILQRDYNIDDEAISKYFPMEHVVEATLQIYQELFGLKFELEKNPHVWHQDVKMYCVYDHDSNDFIGHFYLDLFPRPGKYTHAAEFGLQKSALVGGKRQFGAAAMVANFTKPTPTSPSLLKHNEVKTWAHELGHVLHELLSTSQFAAYAGTSVARDFVEAPSQALENWCYEKPALLRLSKHYETGAPLPDDFINSLVKSRRANIANFVRRQLFFGTFDMNLHSLTPKDPVPNISEMWHTYHKALMKVAAPEGTNGSATFGHLMGGYQAGYYGYLWSEVFSADIFAQFKKKDIFDGKLGREYRNKVLAPGGSRDEMISLREFLGREPNNHAFLESMGLL